MNTNSFPPITAAVLHNTKEKLQVQTDIQVPELKRGQVLCKIRYAGLCHSQLMEVKGLRGEDKFLPHMLGHEATAEVIETGPGVKKVKVGQSVVLGWIKGEGIDAGGAVYEHQGSAINAGPVTTFSNYAVISENRIVPLPEGFDDKTAVLFGCALPTGAGIVLNQVKPRPNSTIAIVGLGGIGLSALLALRHFAPAHIIAIDIESHKLDLARKLGATHCFRADESGIQEFRSAFGEGVDYSIESAGRVDTIELAFDLVKRGGGLCTFASHPASGDKISLDPFELICGKRIQGSWGGACKPDTDIPIIAGLIKKHNIPVDLLLSREYSLDTINSALEDLEARKIARALIKVG